MPLLTLRAQLWLHYVRLMFQTNEMFFSVPSNDSSAQEFTWRKLFLRKGKLRASSRTSALMSGFAMVKLRAFYYSF